MIESGTYLEATDPARDCFRTYRVALVHDLIGTRIAP